MVRSRFFYNQTALGDCGHVVSTWPQITDIFGGNKRVFCDDCVREKYGLDAKDKFILVKLKTSKPKATPRKSSPKRKPDSPNQLLLMLDGLDDGET